MSKKEFVNYEWDQMCEASAQKLADELKKKEAEKILNKSDSLKEGDSPKEIEKSSSIEDIVKTSNSEEPPEKKARLDCVPIQEDPNKLEHKESSNDCNDDSDSDSESVNSDQPVVEVQLGQYIAAPSGYQTLFHGCELPIQRLIEEADDSESEKEVQDGNDHDDESEAQKKVQNEEKTEKPSSLETES